MIKISAEITEKLFDSVVDIVEQILLCGGEVHRAEESLMRMLAAYGAKKIDVFIITSSIVATVHTENGDVFTQTRRILKTNTDCEKLHKLNELSRNICKYKYSSQEINQEYAKILEIKAYPLWLEFIAYSLIGGAFTLFFGGGFLEAAVALIIGAVVRLVVLLCNLKINNIIFIKFLSSFCITALAYLSLKIGIVTTVDNIIIGNIMTLIPGVGFTTALKDLLVGDSLAGTLRTIEAGIAALSIAAGYFVFTFLI